MPERYAFTGQWFDLKAQFKTEAVHSKDEAEAAKRQFEHSLILRLSETFPPEQGFSIAVKSNADVGCYAQTGAVMIGSLLDAASTVFGALAGGELVRHHLTTITREIFPNNIAGLRVATGEPVETTEGGAVPVPTPATVTTSEEVHHHKIDARAAPLSRDALRSTALLLVIVLFIVVVFVKGCVDRQDAKVETERLREQLDRIEAQTKGEPIPAVSLTCAPAPPTSVRLSCPAPPAPPPPVTP